MAFKGVKFVDDGLPGLANQLWAIASLIAYGMETGVPLAAPCFYRFYWAFPKLSARVSCPRPLRILQDLPGNKRVFRCAAAIVRRGWKRFVMDAAEKVHLPPSPPWPGQNVSWSSLGMESRALVFGWMVRNPVGLVRHREAIVELLSPSRDIIDRSGEIVQATRRTGRTLYGVHWRRNDYRQWQGGRFFLEPEDIRSLFAAAVKHEQAQGRGAAFLIASDEPVPDEVCRGFPVTVVKSRNAMVDLAVLAACDEVVGSHSTFGRWAAYAGGKPFRVVLPGHGVDWSRYETLRDVAGPVSPNDAECKGWLANSTELQ